jgi:lipopolysaccharide export system protein LptC
MAPMARETRNTDKKAVSLGLQIGSHMRFGRNASALTAFNQQGLKWRERSRNIKILRLLLPGLIVFLLVLIIGWIVVQTLINALNIYGAAGLDIRMTNIRYVGTTKDGQHYEVSGLEGIRHGNNDPRVILKSPSMEMRRRQGAPNQMQSISGTYNDLEKTFEAKGRVIYTGGAAKMSLKTQSARVDIEKDTVTGDSLVEAQWDKGHIIGQSFSIHDKGSRIVFYGKGEKQVTAIFNAASKSRSQP